MPQACGAALDSELTSQSVINAFLNSCPPLWADLDNLRPGELPLPLGGRAAVHFATSYLSLTTKPTLSGPLHPLYIQADVDNLRPGELPMPQGGGPALHPGAFSSHSST